MITAAKRYAEKKRPVQPHCTLNVQTISGRCGIYLWIVLGVASVQRDGLQIQAAVKVDGSHDVSLGAIMFSL